VRVRVNPRELPLLQLVPWAVGTLVSLNQLVAAGLGPGHSHGFTFFTGLGCGDCPRNCVQRRCLFLHSALHQSLPRRASAGALRALLGAHSCRHFARIRQDSAAGVVLMVMMMISSSRTTSSSSSNISSNSSSSAPGPAGSAFMRRLRQDSSKQYCRYSSHDDDDDYHYYYCYNFC